MDILHYACNVATRCVLTFVKYILDNCVSQFIYGLCFVHYSLTVNIGTPEPRVALSIGYNSFFAAVWPHSVYSL